MEEEEKFWVKVTEEPRPASLAARYVSEPHWMFQTAVSWNHKEQRTARVQSFQGIR